MRSGARLALRSSLLATALVVSGCGVQVGGHGQHPRATAVAPPVVAKPQVTAQRATPPSTSPVASTPCTGNRRPRYVFLSIHRQQMWMCAKQRVAYSTPITSGMVGQYTETPTGTFEVQGRNRNTTLTLNTGEAYPVKYWIPFDAPLFGFHDSPWQRFPYGSPKYQTEGSHGCVHMPLAAIRFLYGWADIGTTVRIAT
jgi:lipoprotein-anchoring transpeptidase ErfK/SrfK